MDEKYPKHSPEWFAEKMVMIEADFDILSDCLDCTNDVDFLEFILSEHPSGETITQLFNTDLAEVKRVIRDVLPNCMSPSPKEITGKIRHKVGESLEQINTRKMKMVWIDNIDDASGNSSTEESGDDELFLGWESMLVTVPQGMMCYQYLCVDYGWITCVFTTDNVVSGNVD